MRSCCLIADSKGSDNAAKLSSNKAKAVAKSLRALQLLIASALQPEMSDSVDGSSTSERGGHHDISFEAPAKAPPPSGPGPFATVDVSAVTTATAPNTPGKTYSTRPPAPEVAKSIGGSVRSLSRLAPRGEAGGSQRTVARPGWQS